MLGLVLDTSLDAAIVMRRDGTVAGWNVVAEMTFGWAAAEAIGRQLAELIIPEDLRAKHNEGLKRYCETGVGLVLNSRIEITALRKNGELFPIELAITPTLDDGEEVFLGFLRDISTRKAAEAALIESEQRLRATYEHAFVSIAETDREGRFLRTNAQLPLITGYSEEELRKLTIFDITHPEDVAADQDQYERQWRGDIDSYTIEKRYLRKDGGLLWIEVLASLLRDEHGAPRYGIRVVRDITERKQSEFRQQLLISELNHRVKNSLAIVQAIAHQTIGSKTPQFHAFSGRLRALAAAHDLLTEVLWDWIDLRNLVERVLQPYRDGRPGRLVILGQSLPIPPKLAVTFSMAFHELATNAAKYGALSGDNGEVQVSWAVEEDNSNLLRLEWKESGGPPVAQPTNIGFGTRLIERSLSLELGGEVSLEFRPEGLVCVIVAPTPVPETSSSCRG
ncbi:MAG TPA: PAS domain S-box protein [Devosiaceae bacterium]|jgi:PAS domain S-box-containing protein|nr:PAS domain S-box protein [Devosiaceae bacterium]